MTVASDDGFDRKHQFVLNSVNERQAGMGFLTS